MRPLRRWVALALVVALAAGLAKEEHGIHHRKFDMAVGDRCGESRDWNPRPRLDEPNDLEMANYSLENFEVEQCLDGGADFRALVIYETAETLLESHGCSWMGKCCVMKRWWIGTTMGRIGTSMELALRIGTSSHVGQQSMREFCSIWTRPWIALAWTPTWTRLWLACAWTSMCTPHGIACAWTSMWTSFQIAGAWTSTWTRPCIAVAWSSTCTTCSLGMTWLSRWPMTSCIAFGSILIIVMVNKYNKMMRRQRPKRLSRLSHCRGPYRRAFRWNGNLSLRWTSYIRMKGMVFLVMYTQCAGYGCSSSSRSSWKDYGALNSSNNGGNYSKSDAGSFQCWWR